MTRQTSIISLLALYFLLCFSASAQHRPMYLTVVDTLSLVVPPTAMENVLTYPDIAFENGQFLVKDGMVRKIFAFNADGTFHSCWFCPDNSKAGALKEIGIFLTKKDHPYIASQNPPWNDFIIDGHRLSQNTFVCFWGDDNQFLGFRTAKIEYKEGDKIFGEPFGFENYPPILQGDSSWWIAKACRTKTSYFRRTPSPVHQLGFMRYELEAKKPGKTPKPRFKEFLQLTDTIYPYAHSNFYPEIAWQYAADPANHRVFLGNEESHTIRILGDNLRQFTTFGVRGLSETSEHCVYLDTIFWKQIKKQKEDYTPYTNRTWSAYLHSNHYHQIVLDQPRNWLLRTYTPAVQDTGYRRLPPKDWFGPMEDLYRRRQKFIQVYNLGQHNGFMGEAEIPCSFYLLGSDEKYFYFKDAYSEAANPIIIRATLGFAPPKNPTLLTQQPTPPKGTAPLPADVDQKMVNFLTDLQKPKNEIWVVDVWASWCGPCIAFIPEMKRIHGVYENEPVKFFGVSVDKDSQAWLRALDKYHPEGEQLIATTKELKTKLNDLLPSPYIPSIFIIDRSGKITKVQDRTKLSQEIRNALGG